MVGVELGGGMSDAISENIRKLRERAVTAERQRDIANERGDSFRNMMNEEVGRRERAEADLTEASAAYVEQVALVEKLGASVVAAEAEVAALRTALERLVRQTMAAARAALAQTGVGVGASARSGDEGCVHGLDECTLCERDDAILASLRPPEPQPLRDALDEVDALIRASGRRKRTVSASALDLIVARARAALAASPPEYEQVGWCNFASDDDADWFVHQFDDFCEYPPACVPVFRRVAPQEGTRERRRRAGVSSESSPNEEP